MLVGTVPENKIERKDFQEGLGILKKKLQWDPVTRILQLFAKKFRENCKAGPPGGMFVNCEPHWL
jgi:hypothetical protein